MKKHIVRNGKRIKGFIYQDKTGQYYYAFGRPSQDQFISFACKSIEHGIACIEIHTLNH